MVSAGLETVTFERTEGYENSLTVNVISTVMLSVLALPKLKETAKVNGAHTNLVIVGSMQHVFAPSAQLDVKDGRSIFKVLREEKSADMMGRYGCRCARRRLRRGWMGVRRRGVQLW